MTLRRSRTGRWNTIAWRRGSPRRSGFAQWTCPDVGASRPWQMRISTLLPAPLGPRITVRGPASSSRSTASRIGRPPRGERHALERQG